MSQSGQRPSAKSLFAAPPAVELEDFQILKKLGSGNMGAVYLARQISLDREVALKVLSQTLIDKASFVDRFLREAQVLATLDHSAIVRLYGVGSENGCHYYVMEYINGYTLAYLRDCLGGRLTVGDALHVVLQCAAALQHAHERQIVHRDVKPENVMINHLGAVKITDLGLAKTVDSDLGLTETGIGIGTPRYMAPEQARDGKHADPRCDIYALGGVFYQLLTGRLPFEAESSVDFYLAKERGTFPPARRLNRDVPPRLELMIDKMLTRDPKYRYKTCAEVMHDLSGLELANEQLSFNPVQTGRVLKPNVAVLESDAVEVLLIHEDAREIRLIQDALFESRIVSNLRVIRDAEIAVALLRREGMYATMPRPNLLLLGLPLIGSACRTVLHEIRDNESLHSIPIVILSAPAHSAELLAADGLRATLTVTTPAEIAKVEDVIRSMHSLCLTVVEDHGSQCAG